MLMPHQIFDLSPIGMIVHVTRPAEETGGELLEMDWKLMPKAGGTPLHIHPTAKETYKVVRGQLEINIDGQWQLLNEGEELTVPEGTPHTFRNPTNSIVKVHNTHSPALQFQDYFEGLSRMVSKLSNGPNQKLKVNFTTAMYLSMLMKKFRREIVSVNPPNFIVATLNGLGKLRGIKV